MPAGHVLQPLLKGKALQAESAAQANMQGLGAAHYKEHLHIPGEGLGVWAVQANMQGIRAANLEEHLHAGEGRSKWCRRKNKMQGIRADTGLKGLAPGGDRCSHSGAVKQRRHNCLKVRQTI